MTRTWTSTSSFRSNGCRSWPAEGVVGGLTRNFFSFIGYNMDPERFERTVAHGIADAVAMEEQADAALLVPACLICHQSVGLIQRAIEARGSLEM